MLLGLAARELAGKLEHIDYLNLGAEALSPILAGLMAAGRRWLERAE